MEITVHSNLPFVQGQVTVATDANQTVDSLIIAFCIDKGIQHKKEYIIQNQNEETLANHKRVGTVDLEDGEVVFLCQKEPSKDWCLGCNQWWLLAVITLIIGIAGLVAVTLIRVTKTQPFEYGVVIDAGSSHSQVYVYSWKGQKYNDTAIVKESHSCRADGGGMSSYTNDTAKAGESLKLCLDEAVKNIPQSEQKTAPVFLGATAGMRLLRESDEAVSNKLMQSVRDTIKTYPFNFSQPEIQARIIEGIEEGAFSWVTANYLSGNLVKIPGFSVSEQVWSFLRGVNPATHGAMDLGGASTQITFVPKDPSLLPPKDSETLLLYGNTYQVYSHSYLCYGVNEAYRQYQALLVEDQGNATLIYDPCGATGHNITEPYADIFEIPCTLHKSDDYFQNKYQGKTYTFQGRSNSTECKTAVRKVFNFTDTCSNCTFNGVQMPPVTGDYLAFSGFWYAMDFLNLTKNGTTLDDFDEVRQTFCGKSWDQIKQYKVKPDLLEKYCFEAHYIYTLLIEGYKFDATNWDTIQFKQKIDDTDLGWTVGLMLNASNIIPPEYPSSNISVVAYVLLVILFVVFILISMGFFCYAKQLRRRTQEYTRLSTYGSI